VIGTAFTLALVNLFCWFKCHVSRQGNPQD